MHPVDRIIAFFSPDAAFTRMRTRKAMAAYEAADPSRLRKDRPDNRSGDALTAKAGSRIRGYARVQEQNYDLAESVLATLVDHVIGPDGVHLEPTPRNKDGKINKDFAKQITKLRNDWNRKPEVTGELSNAEVERLSFRTVCRDGEYLIQHVEGLRSDLDHGTKVPYSIELIEADLLPFEKDGKNGDNRITQGVERNTWGKPLAYHLYKDHPGDINYIGLGLQTKRVSADKIQHVKITKRFKQARGVSIFAPMLRRIEDLKDYEESERVAARIAAAMCAYIKKGTPDDYNTPESGETDRSFKVKPGMIFDRLQPGEDIGMVDSNRPSSLLEGFRDSMVRTIAGASRGTFSSIARKYEGTYSSQRQELVEGYTSYKALTKFFAMRHTYPVYMRFLNMAILSGLLRVPADLDMDTLYDAECRGPAMPWIDPEKEEKALDRGERAGRRSTQQSIRERGGSPDQVMDEIQAWREEADSRSLVFTTDPKYDKNVPDLIFEEVGSE
jgi:lambda family phage portal protein